MSERKRNESNIRLLYREIAWSGPLIGIINTFLSVYALRMGASNLLVSMLISVPALISILLPLPASRIVQRYRGSTGLMTLTLFLTRFGYLVMALVPWIFPSIQPEAIIAINAIITVPAVFVNLAFIAMFADIIPLKDRARVVSNRMTIVGITSTIAVLLGGKFLDLLVFPLNFQLVFIVGFLTSLVGVYYVWKLNPKEGSFTPNVVSAPKPFWSTFAAMPRNRSFTRFSIGAFVFHWGLYMPAPLFAIYMVRYVDASDGWIALIGTAGGLVAAVANMFWGRLSHSRGNRLVLLITILGLVPHTLMFAATRQVELFLPIGIIVSFFSAGMNISLYNSMLEVCPDEERPGYIAVYSALMNIAVFVAPLVGAQLAERIGIEVAFIVAAVLRLASFVLFAVLRFSPAAEQAPIEQKPIPALERSLQRDPERSLDLVEYIDEETARLHEPELSPA